jgi:valyl-tRNA synthetase
LVHAQTGTAPVAVVDAYRFLLLVQVDVAAERERLGKEVMRQEAEIAKAHSRLATPSSVQRRPAAIVDQVRGWLAQFAATLTKVQEQVARLAPEKAVANPREATVVRTPTNAPALRQSPKRH